MKNRSSILFVPIALLFASIASGYSNTNDVTFCKEVLILHHSHVDVGYTHPQSMYWELQKGYLDAALDMLDRTEAWPEAYTRPKWTAEATAPLLRWLQTAPPKDQARLKKHIKSGRFGISGFEYNTTPLCTAEGLARQLYPVRILRESLGADIRAVNQHDVTGIPWSAVDLLLNSQIELLIMGINLHLSGTPMPRPAVYRWQGPSGRELLVMNGEHYSMFDQWCNPSSRNLETIQTGLYKYLRHIKSLNYPYDFVYLSATHAPYMYDNSPPNQDLPGVVQEWNRKGMQPRLRLITPNELLARIKQIPRAQIPLVKGDWTDYWNFGAGSSAAETRLVREATANAAVIDLLHSWQKADTHSMSALTRIWQDINLYNEHTWGAHNTLDADNPFVVTQWHLKAHPAYESKPLSDFELRRELHRLAANPWQTWNTKGVLVVNPTGLQQKYYVPGTWKRTGKQIESGFMGVPREEFPRPVDNLFGPINLPPYGWQIIPWTNLAVATPAPDISTGSNFIETAFYKLTFNRDQGRITSLVDKQLGREIIAQDSALGFFQLIHETPSNHERSAFHVRSVEGERYGRTGWKPDWKANRTSYTGPVSFKVEKHGRSALVVIHGDAEGLTNLVQTITLHADSPLIDLSARFYKQDIRRPESLYFAFPINLNSNWGAHFDTAGIPTELDAEQIPGSCRDWVTVDTFASMHQPDFGVTLYCPDAPLVQMGNFNWAQKQDSIPRQKNPVMLAWPLNNYWETNFRASQPGIVQFRYSFVSFRKFDASRAMREGQQTWNPPVTHPAFDAYIPTQGQFLDVQGDHVVVTYMKPAEDNQGIILRLVNLGDSPTPARVSLPGRQITAAWTCSTLEEKQKKLSVEKNIALCELPSRRITTIRLGVKPAGR